MLSLSKHRTTFFFLVLLFVLSATLLAIKFAKGYRLDLTTQTFKPTGILAVYSTPQGGQVFVNGKLATATDNTVNLEPGSYEIEIKKETYLPWKKILIIEKELVTTTEAFLFPKVPDIKPLTFSQVQNPRISPDRSKIVFAIPLSPEPPSKPKGTPTPTSPDKGGLWILELNDSPLGIEKAPRQIVKSTKILDLGQSDYFWSPDSRQILLAFANSEAKYLLDANILNQISYLADVTNSLPKILSDWERETLVREEAKLRKLPKQIQEIVKEKSTKINFSPDGTKVSYIATASAEIPENLISPVLAASTQKQSRQLEPNKLYVYDIKEDRNFLIPFNVPQPTLTPKSKKVKTTPSPSPLNTYSLILNTPQWFPTSRHLVWLKDKEAVASEYDGTNLTTIYAGPFILPFVFVTTVTDKLVVLAEISFDKETKPNLYSVSLR